MLQSTGKYKEEKKKNIHLHFAAIITGTPAIIYKWTAFRQGLSQDDLCFQLGIIHICRSKQFSVSFNYDFYIYWNCISFEK